MCSGCWCYNHWEKVVPVTQPFGVGETTPSSLWPVPKIPINRRTRHLSFHQLAYQSSLLAPVRRFSLWDVVIPDVSFQCHAKPSPPLSVRAPLMIRQASRRTGLSSSPIIHRLSVTSMGPRVALRVSTRLALPGRNAIHPTYAGCALPSTLQTTTLPGTNSSELQLHTSTRLGSSSTPLLGLAWPMKTNTKLSARSW